MGVQFLFWTISGIYFSWTDIDEIHGDHFRMEEAALHAFDNLLSPSEWKGEKIRTLSLRQIGGEPFYYINGHILVHAQSGVVHQGLSEGEALQVAAMHMRQDLEVRQVERIDEAGAHHEYRGRPLPAYVVHYQEPDNLKAYVSARDGSFQSVRHRAWRWFDFLWMTHTMDYEGRDNFNTAVLRGFSLLGLVTVLSGFTLWFVTSPTIRKRFKKKKKVSVPGSGK